jgi:hypothetical protein
VRNETFLRASVGGSSPESHKRPGEQEAVTHGWSGAGLPGDERDDDLETQTPDEQVVVFAFGMRAGEIQQGDTEASVRARFGRPHDIVDARAEADRLESQCRDRAAARQLTCKADISCVDLFGTRPPQYLLFVCLNDAGKVIRADTTIMYFSAEHSR